jgi:hypothetical protein
MRIFKFCFLLLAFGCVTIYDDEKIEIKLSDGNIKIVDRKFSKDSNNIALRFCIDEGAFGKNCEYLAILPVKDTLGDLSAFMVLNAYRNYSWISDDTIAGYLDTLPVKNSNTPIKLGPFIHHKIVIDNIGQ